MDRKKVLDALRAYASLCEDACAAEIFHKTGVAKRRSAKVAAVRLCKLLDIEMTDAEAWGLVGLEPPDVDPAAPLPGARIDPDRYFDVGKFGYVGGARPVCAVRVRPKGGGFEAAEGFEDWGYSSRSGFQRHVWKVLHGVFPTAEEAEAKLREVLGEKLRKARIPSK